MFTCTVTGPGILQRAVESMNQVNDNPIRVSFRGGVGGRSGPFALPNHNLALAQT